MSITVEAIVNAPVERVWECWTQPEHVMQWNAASDDWHCPRASNDVRVGGDFHFYMEAKDKSVGFDFSGVYQTVVPYELLAYEMGDGRKVSVRFSVSDEGVKVVETFDAETENSEELQRMGWQAILNRFKAHTESH
jgi:uncharacterized protein YndB with AHSA1/START domain